MDRDTNRRETESRDAENANDSRPPVSPSPEPRRSYGNHPAGDGHQFPNAASSSRETPDNHVFCVELQALEMGQLVPFLTWKAAEVWSPHHVKMPFSNRSVQTKTRAGVYHTEVKRWDVVKGVLGKAKFESSKDLEMRSAERECTLRRLLPDMATLALKLPELCSKPTAPEARNSPGCQHVPAANLLPPGERFLLHFSPPQQHAVQLGVQHIPGHQLQQAVWKLITEVD
ncbi:uncharacterized protein LOC122543190 [Chiloscyllium plagiosum]|uniref:uncharacterized protein LOC122543190 n=1 Tax=Chiloscyllium plagiosum TaxID=36176 RepID=UPI001CB7DE6E|nr:uncharacterized protein LOC122543190 [Chiloscyllium plagiosum]